MNTIKNFKQFFYESLTTGLQKIKDKYFDSLEKFNVYEYTDKISIDLLVIKERGNGTGTKVMEEICSYADSKNLTIILTPSTDFGATSVSRLKEFYKRFGFVENSGKNKIFGIFEKMYRLPKGR